MMSWDQGSNVEEEFYCCLPFMTFGDMQLVLPA